MAETYDLSDPDTPTIVKEVQGKLDYSIDISKWLAEVTDTIASFTVDAQSPLVASNLSHADGVMTAWIDGGVFGMFRKVTFNFITAGGRKDSRSIFLKIRHR
jgi:hypothetical protein